MRFLFVDSITQLARTEGAVRGIKHITADEGYVYPEKDGRMAMMPSIIGEALGQLTAWAVMADCDFQRRPVAGIVAFAEVYQPAYVGDILALESWIEMLDDTAVQYRGEVRVQDNLVFRLEGALGPLLPMQDFIDSAEVRRQFAAIDHSAAASLHGAKILPSPVRASPVPLCFDAITAVEPGLRLQAVMRIDPLAPYFADHFPQKPVLPLTVLLACKIGLLDRFLRDAGWADLYRLQSLHKIKMSDFVRPGDELSCVVTVKQRDAQILVLHYRSTVVGKRVCVVDIVLTAVDG